MSSDTPDAGPDQSMLPLGPDRPEGPPPEEPTIPSQAAPTSPDPTSTVPGPDDPAREAHSTDVPPRAARADQLCPDGHRRRTAGGPGSGSAGGLGPGTVGRTGTRGDRHVVRTQATPATGQHQRRHDHRRGPPRADPARHRPARGVRPADRRVARAAAARELRRPGRPAALRQLQHGRLCGTRRGHHGCDAGVAGDAAGGRRDRRRVGQAVRDQRRHRGEDHDGSAHPARRRHRRPVRAHR